MNNRNSSKCAIIGASGHGKVIAELAELNGFSDIHFFDDKWPALTKVENWIVYGDFNKLLNDLAEYEAVVVAIGHNSTRLKMHRVLINKGALCPPLIHPSATVSPYSCLGVGSVVMAGAIIQAFSIIGQACIINTAATVDHDCHISDGVHISPGSHLAGAVKVGEASWLGIGSSVKQAIKIGSNTVVGAGAAVVKDVLDNQTVIGVPAKPIIFKE